jgi:hypothetical protein
MNDVTERFLEFYNALIERKIVKNAKEFTQKMGVSASLMTELTHERTNVGVNLIQNSVLSFDLNPLWLLSGTGCMFQKTKVDSGNSPDPPFQIKELIDKIVDLSAENALLKKENEGLKNKGRPPTQRLSTAAEPPSLYKKTEHPD